MNKPKIKLLRNLVLIEEQKLELKTEGGLIIPESAEDYKRDMTQPIGTVVAAGAGTKEVPMDVKVGDKVMFLKNVGGILQLDGQEYRCLQNYDIIGIL